MSELTTRSHFNLLLIIRKRLVEDSEAEQARAADNLYSRLESIEWQKWLDTISSVLNNGSYTPKNRAEQIINLVHALEDLDDEEEEEEDDSETGQTIDGQDQIPTGANQDRYDTFNAMSGIDLNRQLTEKRMQNVRTNVYRVKPYPSPLKVEQNHSFLSVCDQFEDATRSYWDAILVHQVEHGSRFGDFD